MAETENADKKQNQDNKEQTTPPPAYCGPVTTGASSATYTQASSQSQSYGTPLSQMYGAPPPQMYGQPPPVYEQPKGGFMQFPNSYYGQMPPPPIVTAMYINTAARPPDYLVLSLISCCFCWPMAICALMASNNSRAAADFGDFENAKKQGQNARNIATVAIITGAILIIACLIIRLMIHSAVMSRIHSRDYNATHY